MYLGYIGSGPVDQQWQVVTSNWVAENGDKLFINTSNAEISVTLPPNPTLGDSVKIVDGASNFHINSCGILRNGKKIMGLAEDMFATTRDSAFTLVYLNETLGWRIESL